MGTNDDIFSMTEQAKSTCVPSLIILTGGQVLEERGEQTTRRVFIFAVAEGKRYVAATWAL